MLSIYLPWWMSGQTFHAFLFIELFFLLLLIHRSSLYNMHTTLYQLCVFQIYSPSIWLAFLMLKTLSFEEKAVFNFAEFSFTYLFIT